MKNDNETQYKNKKLVFMNNFSFSHIIISIFSFLCFPPFQRQIPFLSFILIIFVVYNYTELIKCKNLLFW